jgi:hypothetical protein
VYSGGLYHNWCFPPISGPQLCVYSNPVVFTPGPSVLRIVRCCGIVVIPRDLATLLGFRWVVLSM